MTGGIPPLPPASLMRTMNLDNQRGLDPSGRGGSGGGGGTGRAVQVDPIKPTLKPLELSA